MPDMNRSVTVLKDFFKLFVEGWTTFFRLGSKLPAKKIFPRSKKLRGNSSKPFWISYLSSNELRNFSALQYQRKILRLPQTTPILLFGLRCCVFCQKDSKTKTKERNTSIKCTLNQYLSWYSSVAGRKALPSSVIFARSLWKIAWSNYCPFSGQIFACGKFRIGSVTYFLG